ncbi:MAG: hypothetical protein M0R37_14565 [Bacteroidales bacterium]|jgi:hypothetical protein|nr:hypothetical protein [Sphaerochaeta sp.]MCK9629800.1 hypothetical protein [Bacteroidales bacterium]
MKTLTMKASLLDKITRVIAGVTPAEATEIYPATAHEFLRDQDKLVEDLEKTNSALLEAYKAGEEVTKVITDKYNELGKGKTEDEQKDLYDAYVKEQKEAVEAKKKELGVDALLEAEVAVDVDDKVDEFLTEVFTNPIVIKKFQKGKNYLEIIDALKIQ